MEVLQRTANRGSISTGYDIDNSLKVEQDNTEYLTRTVSSTGNRNTGTISVWVKRTEVGVLQYIFEMGGTDNNTDRLHCRFNSGDTLNLATGSANWRITNRVFRDTSAWYHIVVAVDTTQATAADRVKIYINGVEETSFSTSNDPSQNDNTGLAYQTQVIAYSAIDATGSLSGYLTDVYVIDGQQLAASDFGEFDSDTGIWKPKAYTGSYGTNGVYLDFESSGSLGADSSGNGNNFTLNNITSVDQATDTPTNNFCTMTSVANFYRDPKTKNATNGGTLITDSNVTNNWTGTMSTTPLFTGKWYWEVYMFQPAEQMCGIHDFNGNVGSNANPYQVSGAQSWVVYGGGAYWIKSIDGSSTNGGSETQFSNNTIVGVALDLDNHLLTFYENGGSAGTNLTNIDISSLTNTYPGPWMPFVGVFRNTIQTNFGGFSGFTVSTGNTDDNGYGNFEYAPPSGFLAICSKNLAES